MPIVPPSAVEVGSLVADRTSINHCLNIAAPPPPSTRRIEELNRTGPEFSGAKHFVDHASGALQDVSYLLRCQYFIVGFHYRLIVFLMQRRSATRSPAHPNSVCRWD
jgi:hypothetical protein